MNADEFRTAAHAAVEDIIEYYRTVSDRPVLPTIEPGYLRPRLPSGAPQSGEAWDKIRPDIHEHIMPGLTHWNHPGFMAFFPANTSYPGILGELYSAALTAPAFNWLCSPASTELETVVLDWVADILGLPEAFQSRGQGGGVIQGTASDAIATVMVAARERVLRQKAEQAGFKEGSKEQEDLTDGLRGKLVALGSEQAHSSTHKGAIIAGTKFHKIAVKREDNFALRGYQVRAAIEECKREGKIPYYLTVSLGATSTCEIDNFEEVAEVLKDHPEVWVHVDAAYAGSALVLPEYQHLAKSFDRFDSFDMNMHKWLLTNFDCSCLYVRRRRDLTDSLSITPAYLRNTYSESGIVTDYRDWSIPLGRRFRSLKIWFVLRSYGISGLQAHIKGHIQLGELFASLIQQRKDLFTIFTGPTFALTVITVNPRRKRSRRQSIAADKPDPSHEAYTNDFTPDAAQQALVDANRVTKEVYERVNKQGEVFLTSTVVAGTYVIRVVSGSPFAEEKWIRRAFDILVEVAEQVLAEEEGKTEGAKPSAGST